MGDGSIRRPGRFALAASRSLTGVLLAAGIASPAWANCAASGPVEAWSVGASLAGATASRDVDPADLSDADRAMAVRVLQSELMVAGLACGAKAQYGQFAGKYRSTLVKNGKALRAHFSSVHGSSKGFKKLNTYVTRVANEASSRMAKRGSAYCDQAMATFGALLAGGAADLEAYSVRYVAEIDGPRVAEPRRKPEAGDIQLAENCPAESGSEQSLAQTSE